ncbi:MAG: M56 family metallopeptidase [Eubacteriales bacterium]|nr:M56 family metallopeptidase [Eubacteriales bacterium]
MDIYEFTNFVIMTTIAAVGILTIKFVLKEKITPRAHVLIWLVLIFQIAFFPIKGLLPESDFALATYVPSYETQEEYREFTASEDIAATVEYEKQNAKTKELVTTSQMPIQWHKTPLLFTLLLFALFLTRHILYMRAYYKLPLCNAGDILELFEECKRQVGVKSDIRLKTGADSPMLAGIIRPVIYISSGYSREELRYVIIHELCHYKNKDIWLNILSVTVLCLFWYNPVIWLCFYVFRRDMEIYCDERVIKITEEGKGYAATLLKAAVGTQFLLATSSLISGEKEVVRRINRMAALKKPKVWATATVACVAALFTLSLLLNGASAIKTVTYPTQQDIDNVIFDIPGKWIKGIEKTKEGQLIFDGGKAGTAYLPMSAEVHNAIGAAQSARYGTLKDTAQLAEKTDIVNDIKKSLPGQVEKIDAIDGYDWSGTVGKYFTAVTEKEGKRYNWAIGAGWAMYAVWAEEEQASQKDLLNILKTTRYLERPEDGLLTSFGGNIKYYLDEMNQKGNSSANKLLKNYLQANKDIKLPVDKAISGYKIHSLVPVKVKKDSPLAEIYPNAYIYKADYEVFPEYKELYSYDTYNGTDFSITKKGAQRYQEKYLLFTENVYLDKNDVEDIHQFYFVGFLSEEDIEEKGLESVAYELTSIWYYHEIQGNILKYLENKYVGNAVKTSKIIRALPMNHLMDFSSGTYTKEDKGIVLLTEEEPFGLILNYNVSSFDSYIQECSINNVSILSNAIGNMQRCIIQLHCDTESGKKTRIMDFELTPGGGLNMDKMKITEKSAY